MTTIKYQVHNNFINRSISNVFMNSLFSHYIDYEFSWISFSHDNEQWWECLWKSQINQVARLVQVTSIIQTQKSVVDCLKVNDIFYRKIPFFWRACPSFFPIKWKINNRYIFGIYQILRVKWIIFFHRNHSMELIFLITDPNVKENKLTFNF